MLRENVISKSLIPTNSGNVSTNRHNKRPRSELSQIGNSGITNTPKGPLFRPSPNAMPFEFSNLITLPAPTMGQDVDSKTEDGSEDASFKDADPDLYYFQTNKCEKIAFSDIPPVNISVGCIRSYLDDKLHFPPELTLRLLREMGDSPLQENRRMMLYNAIETHCKDKEVRKVLVGQIMAPHRRPKAGFDASAKATESMLPWRQLPLSHRLQIRLNLERVRSQTTTTVEVFAANVSLQHKVNITKTVLNFWKANITDPAQFTTEFKDHRERADWIAFHQEEAALLQRRIDELAPRPLALVHAHKS
jgi:hypothetical protein